MWSLGNNTVEKPTKELSEETAVTLAKAFVLLTAGFKNDLLLVSYSCSLLFPIHLIRQYDGFI